MKTVHALKTIRSRRSVLLVAVLVCVFALGATALLQLRGSSIDAKARAIIASCDKGSGDHAPCYESEVPQLYPQFSVPQIFGVVHEIRAADSSYQFCHVLAHKIGERVVAQDPNAWVDAIPLNPADGYCSNGFIHGVIGGRFRSEVLDDATVAKFMPDFKRACEPHDSWHPSDLDKAICYHGMGHLFDFITNADLHKALSLCSQVAPSTYERTCVEGVFMQIYQPLEPDDFALIKQMKVQPTPDTVRQFCAAYKEPEYVGACLRESWPMQKGILDGTGVRNYCSGQPNAELEDRCYQSAFSIIGRIELAKPDVQAAACSIAPTDRQQYCYSVIADTILEEDRMNAKGAIAFCARSSAYAEQCYSYLIQTAQFNFGNNAAEYRNFCAALPARDQGRCNQATPGYRQRQ